MKQTLKLTFFIFLLLFAANLLFYPAGMFNPDGSIAGTIQLNIQIADNRVLFPLIIEKEIQNHNFYRARKHIIKILSRPAQDTTMEKAVRALFQIEWKRQFYKESSALSLVNRDIAEKRILILLEENEHLQALRELLRCHKMFSAAEIPEIFFMILQPLFLAPFVFCCIFFCVLQIKYKKIESASHVSKTLLPEFFIPALCSAVLFYYLAGIFVISQDETLTAFYTTFSFGDFYGIFTAYETHPPLHFLLVRLFSVFGSSFLWLRISSYITYLISLYVITKLCAQFYSRKCAFYTGVFFVVSANTMFFSFYLRGYSLFFMLSAISAYCFLNTDIHKKYFVLLCVSSSALVYTHYLGILPLVSLSAAVFLFDRRNKLVHILCTLIIPGILLIPWILISPLSPLKEKPLSIISKNFSNLPVLSFEKFFSVFSPYEDHSLVMPAILVFLILILYAKSNKSPAQNFMVYYFCSCIFLFTAFWVIMNQKFGINYEYRYIHHCFFAFLIAAGHLVAKIRSPLRKTLFLIVFCFFYAQGMIWMLDNTSRKNFFVLEKSLDKTRHLIVIEPKNNTRIKYNADLARSSHIVSVDTINSLNNFNDIDGIFVIQRTAFSPDKKPLLPPLKFTQEFSFQKTLYFNDSMYQACYFSRSSAFPDQLFAIITGVF